jgi:methionine-rich copper-binding protein CopC
VNTPRWRLPAAALTLLALGAGSARAATMHVMASQPSANAVMAGPAEQFYIRFDGPVDHNGSTLSVLRAGQVLVMLHPRLNSQPNTLYATVGRLPAGDYVLHWRAVSAPDRDATEGDIPFGVR